MKLLLRATALGVSGVLALFIMEAGLAALGYPREFMPSPAHPPNFQEVRTNIEFEQAFRTNSQGLRYDEIPLARENGSHRLFVLGDSYVEGHGVEADERWTDLLERGFDAPKNPTRFINGGLAGQGPLQYARLLVHVGLKYDLDGLVICLYANDVSDTPGNASVRDVYPSDVQRGGGRRLLHGLWPRLYSAAYAYKYRTSLRNRSTGSGDFIEAAVNRAHEIGLAQEEIDAWLNRLPPALKEAARNGQFNGAILAHGLLNRSYWTDALGLESEHAVSRYLAMEALLDHCVAEARDRDLPVALIFCPTRFQYDRRALQSPNPWVDAGVTVRPEWYEEPSEVQHRLGEWAKRRQVSLLDLTPALKQAALADQNLNFWLDGHWNPRGHRVVAKAITEWLERDGPFPWLKNAP